jgi:lauroyl/myristoyl acyltransferase
VSTDQNDTAPAAPALSEEFFLKVNDMIQSANRIERRFDTHHAVMVMLHAFSRYSAHHYRVHAKTDDQEGREAFAAYMARGVEELIVGHIAHLAGEPTLPSAASQEPSAE